MVERFTERARRTLFFARYAVTEHGSPAIEPEHMLLALCRQEEIAELVAAFGASVDEIRQTAAARLVVGERIPTSKEIPLARARGPPWRSPPRTPTVCAIATSRLSICSSGSCGRRDPRQGS